MFTQDDDPAAISEAFCTKHGMSKSLVGFMAEQIQSHIDRLTKGM
jgi:hypothetical protein